MAIRDCCDIFKLVEDLGIGDLYIEGKKAKAAPKKLTTKKAACK
ncbi:hypothetical protein [Chitinophaga filiformis]|uniref:Uncharacterized protein n=1 Tax=Chitinophaga filiformis TaxID=104663 RepID=A0A1G7WJZ1_CHIFI|nr:hypothetical protein [Chitinophaga filiformis]SDG72327.1 hypothetical protein SAMN04488121_10632 [Chitinophaga filiformis]